MKRLKINLLARAFVYLLGLAFLSPAPALSSRSSYHADDKKELSFAVIGDSGTGKEGQYAVARQMKNYREKRDYNFVLMLGDNIYANGAAKDFKKKFELPYAALLEDGVKFYASLGNHDVRQGRDAQINYDKFNMGGRRYYSFTEGDGLIEFFALDSTLMNKPQLAWLEEKLKVSTAQWKVAFFHHPLYSSAKRHGSDMNLRATLEPLFVRYQVNVVFSGHDHVYERIKLQQGVQYFVQGASGQLRKKGMQKNSDITAASNDAMHSFLVVQVKANEMQVEAIGETGAVLDNIKILKPIAEAFKTTAR